MATEMIAEAIKDVEFYLIELVGRNPWNYARYHCGRASNVYSRIHWPHHSRAKPRDYHPAVKSAERRYHLFGFNHGNPFIDHPRPRTQGNGDPGRQRN
jgi:hypothetical protein